MNKKEWIKPGMNTLGVENTFMKSDVPEWITCPNCGYTILIPSGADGFCHNCDDIPSS